MKTRTWMLALVISAGGVVCGGVNGGMQLNFRDEGQVCLLNLDYEHECKFVFQQFGDKESMSLKPGAAQIVESVDFDADEKLNA